MLSFKVIGAGAAGNKAAIKLAENGFNLNDIILINSTSRDIPEKYRNNSIIFGTSADTLGGCGKEREVGKRLILTDMKMGNISLDGIADPNTNAVIIVSSTEGGSGSAVTPILAKYIKGVLGLPVIIVLFFGFNSDVRGMQNSIEICQELSDDCGVIGISNAKFLDTANQNKIKAEQLANEEFVKFVNILSGSNINAADQNIDDTDLFKLVITPGYMCIGSANVSKVKNREQFNKNINEAIDNSKLLDISEKGAKRIGVIFDTPEEMADSVDYNAHTIQNRYGIPYEMFTHIQNQSSGEVTWIAAGLPLPLKEVKEIYENYMKASSNVNKNKDAFHNLVGQFTGNKEDAIFNELNPKKAPDKKAKAAFFADFGIGGSDK